MMCGQSVETAQKRGHHLTVMKEDGFDRDYPHFEHEVTCLVPSLCGGWQECLEAHEVDGKSAADGPWEAEDGDPWQDQDEFVFHGVEHEWQYGYGWTVPFPGCVVAANDHVCDFAHDIGLDHGEGTYLVDDDWGGGELERLDVIERVVLPPAQTGDAQ